MVLIDWRIYCRGQLVGFPISFSSCLYFSLRIDRGLQVDCSQQDNLASLNSCPRYYPVTHWCDSPPCTRPATSPTSAWFVQTDEDYFGCFKCLKMALCFHLNNTKVSNFEWLCNPTQPQEEFQSFMDGSRQKLKSSNHLAGLESFKKGREGRKQLRQMLRYILLQRGQAVLRCMESKMHYCVF